MSYPYPRYNGEANAEAQIRAYLTTWQANHTSKRLGLVEANISKIAEYGLSLVLGNMSLRMEDTENRLISEPVLIGSDRLEGHICKYAEKSYMYKYDLGHILSIRLLNVVEELYRVCNTQRERERSLPPSCNRRHVWRRGKC